MAAKWNMLCCRGVVERLRIHVGDLAHCSVLARDNHEEQCFLRDQSIAVV